MGWFYDLEEGKLKSRFLWMSLDGFTMSLDGFTMSLDGFTMSLDGFTMSLDNFTRQKYIDELSFYYKEARERFEPAFVNLDDIYVSMAQNLYGEAVNQPGTGDECLGSLAEKADTQALTYTFLLERMRMDVLLSFIVSIYHQWEKQLASWFTNELSLRFYGEEIKKVKKRFWCANFCDRIECLEAGGWELRGKEIYETLNQHRLIVNVYKHGEGRSFQDLKKAHPEFLIEDHLGNKENIDPRLPFDLTFNNLEHYTSNLIRFWEEFPTQLSWVKKVSD